MRILGIETSCDETAAAVVEKDEGGNFKVLSNVVSSSLPIHQRTGGIIPENAARKQIEYIIPVIQKALEDAGLIKLPNSEFTSSNSNNNKTFSVSPSTIYQLPTPDVDAIAVTVGPGLIGSLLVGVETAKTLATLWNKKLIPVNHLLAHIYANWISQRDTEMKTPKIPQFPAIALVVSGGHTDLVYMKDHNDIEYLGGTRDDAAGEAFDKTARILGLPYPGGPSISKSADEFLNNLSKDNDDSLTLFPRPMINDDSYDFSFSGLKTAVLNHVKSDVPHVTLGQLSAEIQESIVDVIVKKSVKALKEYRVNTFLLSGGVSANSRLVRIFTTTFLNEKMKINFHVPEPKYCTDNGAAIAVAGFFSDDTGDVSSISATPQLSIMGL